MKTNVSETSISVFHDPATQSAIASQRERVARRVIAETKAGKPSCIGSLYDYFNKAGDAALSQKSNLSRACNELKEDGGITVDGRKYAYNATEPKRHGRNVVKHFCLVLINKPQGEQIEMFND